MHKAAIRFGFIAPDAPGDKKSIRDRIRQLPDGEMKWRKLQAFVYGEAMGDASLMEGVKNFFELCKKVGIQAYIVSHKTEFAAGSQKRINLRRAALKWMEENKFFDADGLGLSPSKVYFEPTRGEKIERIKRLGCTHFIDDLEETFLEESFPGNVDRILYSPHEDRLLTNVKIFKTWTEIEDHFSAKR